MNTGEKKKNKNLIFLGNCTKPHGIKGGFSFFLENNDESVLKNGLEITLFPTNPSSSIDKNGENFVIDKISFGNKTICYLKDINDRNVVESMIPFEIHASRDIFPEPKEGEFYVADLIGLKVLEHGTDREIGKVTKFFDNGMQLVLTIRGDQSFDIPMVDNFVPELDIEGGKIWVVIPEVV